MGCQLNKIQGSTQGLAQRLTRTNITCLNFIPLLLTPGKVQWQSLQEEVEFLLGNILSLFLVGFRWMAVNGGVS